VLYGALVTLRRGSRCASNSGWDGDTCIMACALRYVGDGAGHDVRVTLCGLRCAAPLIMVRVRVNGSNKRPYRVKARALGLQLVVLTRQNVDPG